MDFIHHQQQEMGVTPPPPHGQSWDAAPNPAPAYPPQGELGPSWGSYGHDQAPRPRGDMEKAALTSISVASPPPFAATVAAHTESSEIQSTYLMRKTARFGPSWVVACLALLMSSVTTYYSTRVMVDQRELPAVLAMSPGRTVLVVNVLSKVVAFLCLSLFTDITEALRWTLACRPRGIQLTSFLAMSRATPIIGVLYLCKVRGMHQIWALQKFLAFVVTFVVSIVLITDVTFKIVFTPYTPKQSADSDPTLQVVAGLAPVSTYGLTNISLTLVPLLATTYTMAFLTDPRFVTKVAPVNCTGTDQDCYSILMPGGMESVRFFNESGRDSTEQPSLVSGEFPGDYDSVVVHDAPAYQIEYQSVESYDSSFRFNHSTKAGDNGDCEMHLQDQDDGLLFCQRQAENVLFLGWSICPDAQFQSKTCQTDSSWSEKVSWSTTVAMYSRRATVAYDRQNISIIGVENLSPPAQIEVPATPFRVYAYIIMGSISQTLNRTSDPSGYGLSAAQFSFGYGAGYILRLYQSTYATYIDGGIYLLRSLVAVPFQFSTAIRQFGNPKQMPPGNIVTVSLSVSAYRAIIEQWTVWTFGIMSLALTLWCMVLLLWMSMVGPYSPNVSFFPEIDITSKATMHPSRAASDPMLEVADKTLEDLARLTRNFGLGNGASSAVVRAIQGKRVYCGSLPDSAETEDHIVLVTEQGKLKVLNKFQRYS